MYYKAETECLLEAALDQPAPTPALTVALNAILTRSLHPDREYTESERARRGAA